MCPSRLPNEETSYRPSGMLDRDQRTAFTIHRIRDGPISTIPTNTMASSFSSSSTTTNSITTLNHRNNRLNFSSNSKHPCNSTQMASSKDERLADYKCDCQQKKSASDSLWEDTNCLASSIHLARKYKTTSGYYRSRTKFANYLLVFTWIWLALIRHTCAYPFPRAAMSGDDQLDPETQRCKAIKDALNEPLKQARLGSNYIRNLLDKYTQVQFKKNPLELHAEWIKHPAHFNYGLEIQKYMPQEFDERIPQEHFEHLHGDGVPSQEFLTMELQNIYACLQTLKKVFDAILEDRKINASRIIHEQQYDGKTHEAISHMFEEQSRYSKFDIAEIESAMTALEIPFPELQELHLGEKNRTIGEWLATREYLKVLRYLAEAYDILQQRCS